MREQEEDSYAAAVAYVGGRVGTLQKLAFGIAFATGLALGVLVSVYGWRDDGRIGARDFAFGLFAGIATTPVLVRVLIALRRGAWHAELERRHGIDAATFAEVLRLFAPRSVVDDAFAGARERRPYVRRRFSKRARRASTSPGQEPR